MLYSSSQYNRYREQENAKVAVYTAQMSAEETSQYQLQEFLLVGAAIASALSAFLILS